MTQKLRIQNLLDEAVASYTFSGYQIYAYSKSQVLDIAGGETSYWPGKKKVTENIYFDIASVTKVISTTSILARACDQGVVSLGQTVGELAPKFAGSVFQSMTLRDLASHQAGLKAWSPIYQEIKNSDVESWFLQKGSSIIKDGKAQEYSDLGMILLWTALEKKLGKLQDVFQREVVAPLNLSGVVFGPVTGSDTAATEYCLWQKKILQGEVFDENARALKHVAPHAGLFSSARSLAPWCHEWLKALRGDSNWLKKETASTFTSRVAAVGSRAVGFDTKSKIGSMLDSRFSDSTFGHLGYTGCSLWIDPTADAFVILLTNRVHPSRYNEQIKEFRIRLHTEVANFWEKK